jgi:preprotein translocase subunit YajC
MHPFIATLILQANEVANQVQEGLVTAQQGLVEAGADPAAAAEEIAQPQPSWFARNSMWIMLLLIFGVMWLFMIRPQRKQQKELEAFRSGLKKGDKVVTAGGIYGTIADIQENSVLIKVDGETKLRVSKNAIQKDYSDNQPAQ